MWWCTYQGIWFKKTCYQLEKVSIEKQSLTIHRYKHHKATSKQQISLLERPPLHGVLSYCVCVAVKSLVRCHIYLSMTKLLLRCWLCKQLALAVKSLVVQLPCLLSIVGKVNVTWQSFYSYTGVGLVNTKKSHCHNIGILYITSMDCYTHPHIQTICFDV